MTRESKPDRLQEPSLDRFRGLMVGTAVGDCLGRVVEGHRRVGDSFIEEILTAPPLMIYTDDTAMTMGLTESLLVSEGFDGADMALRFARAFDKEPYRGYGSGIVSVFEAVLRGAHWEQASRAQFGGQGSFGNGAAMRVAPVALWAYGDLDITIDLARRSATVTHTHPVGEEGAVIQAVAAHHAITTDTDGFDPDRLLSDLDRIVETDEFRAKLAILPSCIEADDDERASLHLGNWVAADNSVVTALYCFLMAGSFSDAIVRAIRIGGDTDTIAAMAGALAGARWGYSTIPELWNQPEAHERLTDLATRTHARTGASETTDS